MHLKKHLSFTAIRQMIAENFTAIKDSRAANSSNTIADVMLSGLGVCRIIYGNLLHNFYNSAILKIQSNICLFKEKLQSNIDNSQQFFLNISFFP